MAYDPADLRLPAWLMSALDRLVRLHLPLGSGWTIGLTRPGAIFLATQAGVVAAALYSGNNLLYLCAAMLLSMGGLALIRGFLLLRLIPDLCVFMPQVSTAHSVLLVHREIAVVRSPFAAYVHAQWEGEGCSAGVPIHCSKVTLTQLRMPVPDRSLLSFSRLRVSTEAPLGLWRLSRVIQTSGWTWAVVPESTNLPALMRAGLPESGEWQDLRAYSRGDAPSRIHWRKSAHGSAFDWVVKRYANREAMQARQVLRVDLRGSPGADFEKLMAAVATWMRMYPDGQLLFGSQAFDLADAGEQLQAWRSLAAASPDNAPLVDNAPPTGSGGMLLSVRSMYAG